ncbi:MAG: hypothetical protein VX320_03100 [Candidatus Thermoplasmatota archaeon]|nr:hypothetical protein [Candidatus Thermoplasmatota archaeon]
MREEEPVLWKTKSGLIHPLQIAWGLVFILCISSFLMSWIELEVGVEFTSGKPERSELILENEIDAELESSEFRIEKATPFVTWIFSRDSLQPEDTEDDTEYKGPQSRVENTRAVTIVTLLTAAAISAIGAIKGPPKMRWIGALWVIGLLLFTIAIPMAWVIDMSSTYDQGLPEDEVPVQEFAHVNSNFSTEIVYIGVALHFDGDGWDLGMFDEENRSAVKEEPPADPDGDHEAHIGWDAHASLRYGNALTAWLLMGLLLFGIFWKQRGLHKIPVGPPVFVEDE